MQRLLESGKGRVDQRGQRASIGRRTSGGAIGLRHGSPRRLDQPVGDLLQTSADIASEVASRPALSNKRPLQRADLAAWLGDALAASFRLGGSRPAHIGADRDPAQCSQALLALARRASAGWQLCVADVMVLKRRSAARSPDRCALPHSRAIDG